MFYIVVNHVNACTEDMQKTVQCVICLRTNKKELWRRAFIVSLLRQRCKDR